jgi:hypothetical protein
MTAKIILLIFSVLVISLMTAWYLVPKFLEQPSYKVVQKNGNIEIRLYDSILLQSVSVSGDQYQALRKGFRPLVSYIGAKKRDGDKISMTAPVMQLSGDTQDDWIISFSMPSKYDASSLPAPNNEQVFTETIDPTKAAVIRFSGNADEELLAQKTEQLSDWLKKSAFTAQSKPRYMFYNDPSTPPFLRRNEVFIEIK